MPGLIQGLEIARRALLAHQAALNVTGNNLANVASPGYTRQVATLAASPPERTPEGYIGTGVQMENVARARDLFLDIQLRDELGLAGKWQARAEVLQRVEGVINEPSDTGLGSALDAFWNAWSDLSDQPEDSATRVVVVQRGLALTEAVRQTRTRLQQIAAATDQDVDARVTRINALLESVAKLNGLIQRAEVGGEVEPNLRDQRDLILDELARMAGVKVLPRSDGSVALRLGGRTVVENTNFTSLVAVRTSESGQSAVRLLFQSDKSSPSTLDGELAGLVETRNQALPDMLNKLDALTQTLITEVNRIHEAGPSRLPFFHGGGALDFEVAPEIAADPNQVNVGTTGDSGDNDIALAMAALRDARLMQNGTATLADFYRSSVTELGALGQQTQLLSESQESAVESLQAQRQSAIGVNVDDELTRMITIQKAYEAAARVFTTVSSMVDTLLNM